MTTLSLSLWKLKTSGDILNEFLDVKDQAGCTYLSFNAANYHLQNFNISGARAETIEILRQVLCVASLIADRDFRKQVMVNPDLLIVAAAKSDVKIEKRGILLHQN